MATLGEQLKAVATQLAALAEMADIQSTAAAVASNASTSGTTASDWKEPPSPWPIDARYLSAEQVSKLSPDATKRANLFQQAWMSAALSGNGQDPLGQAMILYRAAFTDSKDLNKPITDPVWLSIFATYGVTSPIK